MLEKVQALDINEAVTILKEFLVEHEVANTPSNLYNSNSSSENIKEKLADNFEKQTSITSSTDIESTEIVDWFLQTKLEAALIAYHSPYAEFGKRK
ncbi:hypothetical protein QCA50_015757 [Cerrena zonata]|uniref:Uncharacterized protein n=1 Tax=Cerrena zonata TaxID=2478898 RepID=A0AAW0FLU6_9APHY